MNQRAQHSWNTLTIPSMSARVSAARQVATPSSATAILVAILSSVKDGTLTGTRRPPTPALFGGPGLGKTSIVREAAIVAGFEIVEIYLNVREPEALLGCYVPDATGISVVYPPGEFAEQTHEGVIALHQQWVAGGRVGPEPAHRPTVFFLDEFTAARPESMQASERLLLERRLPNGWKFHDMVVFIVAGNLPEHGPTIAELAPTTKTRLWPVLSIEPDVGSWLTWARGQALHPAVVAWVAQNPAALYDVDANRQALTFSVPRTLERLHDVVSLFADVPSQFSLAVQGTIGERGAPLFIDFYNHGRNNPSPEEVLADPEHCVLPKHPAAIAQLSEALVLFCRHDQQYVDPLLRVVKRLPSQFQEFLVDALIHDRDNIIAPGVRQAAAASAHLVSILRGRSGEIKEMNSMRAPSASGKGLLS